MHLGCGLKPQLVNSQYFSIIFCSHASSGAPLILSCCPLAGSTPPPAPLKMGLHTVDTPVTQHVSLVKSTLSWLSSRGYTSYCLKLCLVVIKVMFLGARPSSK